MDITVIFCRLDLRKKPAYLIQNTIDHLLALGKFFHSGFKIFDHLLIFTKKLLADPIGIRNCFHPFCSTVHILAHRCIAVFPEICGFFFIFMHMPGKLFVILFLQLLDHLIIPDNTICSLHITALHLIDFLNGILHGTFLLRKGFTQLTAHGLVQF